MKTIAIGDIHGRSIWKKIIEKEKPNKVVFVGDYFDSRDDISAAEQIHNFKEIIEYKTSQNETEVILLVGNHDLIYYPGIYGEGTTGYQSEMASYITNIIIENNHHLQAAYFDGQYLFSHAGVGKVWLKENGWDNKEDIAYFVNKIWEEDKSKFEFYGFEPTGDNLIQTPVWIRPKSLIKTWQKDKSKPIQIFGHSEVYNIDLEEYQKWTGGKFIMIDALGFSKEYLIIIDQVLSVGKIEDNE